MQQLPHHQFLLHDRHRPKSSISLINEYNSKFINFTGNPSDFNISDYYRTHYETQINENMKIHYEFINESCHVISPWKIDILLLIINDNQSIDVHWRQYIRYNPWTQPMMQPLNTLDRASPQSVSSIKQFSCDVDSKGSQNMGVKCRLLVIGMLFWVCDFVYLSEVISLIWGWWH